MATRVRTLAERIDSGDRTAIDAVARAPVRVRADNLVERPWGGDRLAAYKGLALTPNQRGARFGEAFEIAADPTDAEAAAHPSIAVLEDGSELSLPVLLDKAGEPILGARSLRAHGCRVPLLPKTLDVGALLSVQAHPPGLPELYVVIDAEPGATLRLGFARNVDPTALEAQWSAGRLLQERLLALVRADVSDHVLVAAFDALRTGRRDVALGALLPALRPDAVERDAAALVDELVAVCRQALDLMHALPVRAGDVILNASPETLASPMPSAEMHALGNPEGRAILLLEIRRPGPTLRAWDHARFPLRRLDVRAAMAAMRPRVASPDAYRVTPTPIAGRPGVARAASCAAFVADLVRPERGEPAVPSCEDEPRTLHVIEGELEIFCAREESFGAMRAGESALVPAGVGVALHGEGRAVVASVPGR